VEGEDCGLENLQCCAKATSGSVHALNPLEMDRQMRQIAQKTVLATNATLKLISHSSIAFESAVGGANRQHDKRSYVPGSSPVVTSSKISLRQIDRYSTHIHAIPCPLATVRLQLSCLASLRTSV